MPKSSISSAYKSNSNRFSLATKVIAILVLFVFIACFLITTAASLVAFNHNYYRGTSPDAVINQEIYNHLQTVAQRDLRELARLHLSQTVDEFHSDHTTYSIQHIEGTYSADASNVLYRITDEHGNLLSTNFTELPKVLCTVQISGIYHSASIVGNEATTATELPVETEAEAAGDLPSYSLLAMKESDSNNQNSIRYTIDAYVKADLSAHDSAYYIKEAHLFIYNTKYASILLAMLFLILSFADLIFVCSIAGRHKGEESARSGFFDKLPLEVVIAAYVCLLAALYIFIIDVLYYTPFFYEYAFCAILIIGVYTALFIASLYIITTIAVRIKTKTFWKTTLIYKILSFFLRIAKHIGRAFKEAAGNKSDLIKCILLVLGSIITDVFVSGFIGNGNDLINIICILLWLLKTCCIGAILFKNSLNVLRLIKGSKRIVDGDLDYIISYAELSGDYKELAVNFNHIRDGLSNALEKQIRSERMKTELITNVSHDIKTPLTCIINYVDLLKGEQIESDKAKEYIAVLDKQSARLKKLTEDLIETSKAASGCTPVNAEINDISILLSQAVGEYRDRFEAADLEIITELPQAEANAYCDGRLCWRIFDNLLSNVSKYSLSGTRVYLEVSKSADFVTVTFKNISKNRLNITPEELTERFVRGDSSRNTEGSGLGLSIAESLARLQRGDLQITIDGDMFKVAVTLPTK